DHGFPSPGFQLGFPTIQSRFYNDQAQAYSYLLITPSGARVELRETATLGVYESVDSSYLRLTDGGGGSLLLVGTDGTRMTYFQVNGLLNGDYHCTSIEDRNGNKITVDY